MVATADVAAALVREIPLSTETLDHLRNNERRLAGLSFERDWQSCIVSGRKVMGGSADGEILGHMVDVKLLLGPAFYGSMDAYRFDRKRNTLFAGYKVDDEVARLVLACAFADMREAGCFSWMGIGSSLANGEQGWEVRVDHAMKCNLLPGS